MKEIKLTRGKVALVDDADYEWLNQWSWYAVKTKYTYYAKRTHTLPSGEQIQLAIHREILGLPFKDEIEGDHKDGNGLNNQRYNLRRVTGHQNKFNKHHIKGYHWSTSVHKYQAQIRLNGKAIYLGVFDTEVDARKAYLDAKKIYHVIESQQHCAVTRHTPLKSLR